MSESPVKELDELTRLRIDLRAAQIKRTRKPLFPPSTLFGIVQLLLTISVAVGLVYVACQVPFQPYQVHLVAMLGAINVVLTMASLDGSRKEERLRELERRLEELAEELKKRG
jgi:hypothetical protein